MAEFPMVIPSWIQRDYNPAEIFLSSVKTGAAIGQSQLQLQEEQRQSDLKAQLTREEMQANLLRAQQQLAVDQAYKKQQTDMAQKQLDELKAYHADLRDKAAQDLIIRGINASANVQRAQTSAMRPIDIGGIGYQQDQTTGKLTAVTPKQPGRTVTQADMLDRMDYGNALKTYQDAVKSQRQPDLSHSDRVSITSQARRAQQRMDEIRKRSTTSSGLRYEIIPIDDSGAGGTSSDDSEAQTPEE